MRPGLAIIHIVNTLSMTMEVERSHGNLRHSAKVMAASIIAPKLWQPL